MHFEIILNTRDQNVFILHLILFHLYLARIFIHLVLTNAQIYSFVFKKMNSDFPTGYDIHIITKIYLITKCVNGHLEETSRK